MTLHDDAQDAVFLEGMRFYAFHGVNAAEQELGQRFIVDVALYANLRPAGRSDDLADTINYSSVYKRVRAVVEGPPRRLIETLAEDVAAMLLAEFSAQRVVVTVRKPEAPLRGAMLDAAGVRIVRQRGTAT